MSGQTQTPRSHWRDYIATATRRAVTTITWSHVEAPTAWTADSLSQLIGEPCTDAPSSVVGTWEPFCPLVTP